MIEILFDMKLNDLRYNKYIRLFLIRINYFSRVFNTLGYTKDAILSFRI